MRTFDCTEAQVRLNECGEGEYVRREVAERLYAAIDALSSIGKRDISNAKYDGYFEELENALDFADNN